MTATPSVDELRRERGVAKLDGLPFDSRRITDAEAEADAEAMADAERVRRERAATAALIAERRAKLKADLVALEEDRLKAIATAENAARDLVAALNGTLGTAAAMRGICSRLNVAPPDAVQESAMVTRISHRMTAVLNGVKGHPARFGRIEFGGTFHSPTDVWADKERSEAEPGLAKIVKGN